MRWLRPRVLRIVRRAAPFDFAPGRLLKRCPSLSRGKTPTLVCVVLSPLRGWGDWRSRTHGLRRGLHSVAATGLGRLRSRTHGLRRGLHSVAAARLGRLEIAHPTACAVGYTLTPLRGWGD